MSTLRVTIDTREKLPFAFEGPSYSGTITVAGTLQVGDYAPAGLGDLCAVERKSLPDLILCLSHERDRFERELQRAAALESFCVVVEASWADIAQGNYRSKMSSHSACQSVLALSCRHRAPVLDAGRRAAGE